MKLIPLLFIIIIFYFENVASFHTKLGSDVCQRVNNQTSGNTLQDLTRPLNGKIAVSQLSTHGYWSKSHQMHLAAIRLILRSIHMQLHFPVDLSGILSMIEKLALGGIGTWYSIISPRFNPNAIKPCLIIGICVFVSGW